MNIIERIIANKGNLEKVAVGDEVTVNVDLAVSHDVTGPMAIKQFNKIGISKVFDKNKVAFVIDHNIPASTVQARSQHNELKDFSKKAGAILYDKGEGVIHQVIAEKKLYKKGDIVVGADSHTCTAGAFGAVAIPVGSTELAAVMALGVIDIEVPPVYYINVEGELSNGVYAKDIILYIIGKFGTDKFTDKGIIFGGNIIRELQIEDKMTISNMAIEMGAMIGYVDQGDEIGIVEDTYNIKGNEIEPVAACPSSPGNVKSIKEIQGQALNQVVIGSCTNGRFSDMKIVAQVLKEKKVHDNINLIVIPASKIIADKMDDNGITKVIRDAGGIVANPGCGPCYGAHQGLLSEDDIALSTTNRNFPGRMGHKNARIYLVSPRVAAESAVTGYISMPGTVEQMEG